MEGLCSWQIFQTTNSVAITKMKYDIAFPRKSTLLGKTSYTIILLDKDVIIIDLTFTKK